MNISDYYFFNDKKETKQLLYSNATFNIKEVLSDRTCKDYCSVTVITPSQTISYAFEHSASKGGHAAIVATILSRVYPNYEHTFLGDQEIYENEGENNIFILTTDVCIVIIMPRNMIINKWQYKELIRIFKQIKETEYIKNGNIDDIIIEAINTYFFLNEEIEKAHKMIKYFKSKITKRDIPIQYPISKFDFSNCKTDKSILKYAEIYSEELHKMMNKRKMSSNTLKEYKIQGNVTQLGIETYTKKQVEFEIEKQQNEIIDPQKDDEQIK